MKLVINTQYRENYGAHDWDGEGECPQYWKNKGGSEYLIPVGSTYSTEDMYSSKFEDLFNELCNLICYKNEGSEEYTLDWTLVEDSYVPEYEKQQIEYGDSVYYEPVIKKVNGVWKKISVYCTDKTEWTETWTISKGHELSDYETTKNY